MDNYCKPYAPKFHHVPDARIWPENTVDYCIFPPDVRRSSGHPLLFAYAVLRIENAKVIDEIDVVIARN